MTERINIDKLAREHNFERAAYSYHATPNELATYTRAVMEQCAKVCDAEASIEGIAQKCSAAIREMMP